jgi:hypothetical protein
LLTTTDNAPGIASINRQLRGALHGDAASADFLRTRLRDSIRSYGYYLFNSVTASPVEWNERWITIEIHSQSADEGASGSETGYRTWDVQTGREIDPRKWLGVKMFRDEDKTFPLVRRAGALPDGLKRFLLKTAKVDEACRTVYGDVVEARLEVSQVGISFTLGDTFHPECMQDVLLTFAQLQPFLNEEGKAALRAMTGN